MATHLALAKQYIGRADELHKRAAEEIVAAMYEDPKLNHRSVGEAVGRTPRP